MSDTPETDARRGYALTSHYGRSEGRYLQMDKDGPFVHAEVARKLERERDEVREKPQKVLSERPTPETDRNALLLANLDDWIDDCLRNSKPIGLTLCDARKRISDQSDRIAELWDAMEILRRERDEALEELKDIAEYGTEEINAAVELRQQLAAALVERDEAREDAQCKRVEINHLWQANEMAEQAFRERDEVREALRTLAEHGENEIQKLIKECDEAKRERDEAREKLKRVIEAASAVVDRWEQPSWKDVEPTAAVLYRLRDALGREAE